MFKLVSAALLSIKLAAFVLWLFPYNYVLKRKVLHVVLNMTVTKLFIGSLPLQAVFYLVNYVQGARTYSLIRDRLGLLGKGSTYLRICVSSEQRDQSSSLASECDTDRLIVCALPPGLPSSVIMAEQEEEEEEMGVGGGGVVGGGRGKGEKLEFPTVRAGRVEISSAVKLSSATTKAPSESNSANSSDSPNASTSKNLLRLVGGGKRAVDKSHVSLLGLLLCLFTRRR